jgi:hypothetical protein
MKTKIVGYLASLIVAASLLTLVFFQIVSEYSTTNHGPLDILYVWALMAFWSLVITLLPAAVLICFAERHGWRGFLLYLIVGAALGSITGLWFEFQIMLECAAIGAVAGLTYWAIAGRFAGLRDKALA